MVQPNHRGLNGFGAHHVNAGLGQWGKLILEDLTQVVDHLVDKKITDPNRVCIIGDEIGGYNALLSGALKPQRYQCIVSINGIADVETYLNQLTRYFRGNDRKYTRFEKLIFESNAVGTKNNFISPTKFLKSYDTPTLFIYDNNTPLIPSTQSTLMYKTLKRARKKVKKYKIKSNKAWSETESTRVDVILEISEFLEKYNPAHLD